MTKLSKQEKVILIAGVAVLGYVLYQRASRPNYSDQVDLFAPDFGLGLGSFQTAGNDTEIFGTTVGAVERTRQAINDGTYDQWTSIINGDNPWVQLPETWGG